MTTPTPPPAGTSERLEEIRRNLTAEVAHHSWQEAGTWKAAARDLLALVAALERELAEAKAMLVERDELMNEVRDRAQIAERAGDGDIRMAALEEAAQLFDKSAHRALSNNERLNLEECARAIRALRAGAAPPNDTA